MGLTDINAGDYVSFSRIVQPGIYETYRDATKKAYKVLKQEPCWIDQGGSGLVLKVSKSERNIDGEKHRTARIDAGPKLGIVTASIDDAVIVGVQQGLFIMDDASVSASMYDVTGDGA